MRKFYEVMPNADLQGYEYIENYDLKGFDYMALFAAQPCDKAALAKTMVFIKDEGMNPIDFMSGPISWPIFSDRFLNLVKHEIESDVEILDPPIFSLHSKKKKEGYHLVNILKKIDCMNEGGSTFLPGPAGEKVVCDLQIYPDRVPENVNIFRIPGTYGSVYVSDSFLAKIRGKGLTGLVMQEL